MTVDYSFICNSRHTQASLGSDCSSPLVQHITVLRRESDYLTGCRCASHSHLALLCSRSRILHFPFSLFGTKIRIDLMFMTLQFGILKYDLFLFLFSGQKYFVLFPRTIVRLETSGLCWWLHSNFIRPEWGVGCHISYPQGVSALNMIAEAAVSRWIY